MYKRQLAKNSMARTLRREIEVQSHLQHENICRLLGYFWDEEKIYHILEYVHGSDLFTVLKKQPLGKIEERRAAGMIKQVVAGLGYMHSKDILHRDIKPENLLYSNGVVKIADFGWSARSRSDRRKTVCGTIDYFAPELVQQSPYGKAVDIWAIGILAFELVTGRPPFEHQSFAETQQQIVACQIEFPPHVSELARDFICSILKQDAGQRPTLRKIEAHQWLS